ncbi:MAG TPA: amino acid permease [Gammaproteobacteria bacterium]|nr:amino acid permease [Gammaproteobacteria bacterium]
MSRRLGLGAAIAILVGAVIGSGIFRVPSVVALNTGSLSGIAAVWIVGGAIALFGSLSIAELSALYPGTGGIYVYLREVYGRPLAFLFGWMWLLTEPIAWAALALVFAEYLASVVPMSLTATHGVAALIILVVGAAQYRSVALGAAIQNVSTVGKVLALVALSIVIFALSSSGGAYTQPTLITHTSTAGWGVALIAVLWAYDGWQNLTLIAGEIRRPERNMPIALVAGTLIVIAAYLITNAAYLDALTVPQVAQSKSVAADAMIAVVGRAGGAVIAALVMLSTFGSLNGNMMSGSRVYFAMAEDRLFFSVIGKVHPRFGTPYVAIAFSTVLAACYVMLRDFQELTEAYVLGVWPFLALCVAGVWWLRKKRPDLKRPYKAFGYPVIPALFFLATLAVIANALVTQTGSAALSLGITLVGIPIYFIWIYFTRRTNA